jgi:N6-adenosine-specific RNA methylase IME4
MSTRETKNIATVMKGSPELLQRARQLLAQAQTLPEILKVRNTAKAYEQYFRGAEQSREIAKDAAEIRLRAERKAGEVLAEMAEKGERMRRQNVKSQGVTSTLDDLEITRMQSHRWQEIAKVPEEVFEEYIEEAKKSESHELTTSALRTVAKFHRKTEQAEEIRNSPSPLPTGPFQVIVADPPWPYAMRRPTTNDSRGYPEYSGMTLEKIKAMEVPGLAADDSVLWLWTTNAFLEPAFDICRAWGFEYRTLLTWAKDRIGLGDWLRGQTEHCLMASRGHPVIQIGNHSTLLKASVQDHSRKPDEFYAMVEDLCPAPKLGRVELFARAPRPGWRVWGHESGQ